MTKKTAKVLKWLASFIFVVAAVCAVLSFVAARKLRSAYDALEADGRPLKAEEIIPPEIPDQHNGALTYEAVVLQLRGEAVGDQVLFDVIGDLAGQVMNDPSDAEAMARFEDLAKTPGVQAAVTLLLRGAGKDGCRYDTDYSKGAAILLPHISYMRSLSRLVCAQACAEASAGNAREAWRDLTASLKLADALRTEPMIISQLVRIALFEQSAKALRYVAATCPPLPDEGEEVVALLRRFEDMAPLVDAIDGERLLFGEWAFNLTRSKFRRSLEGVMGDRVLQRVVLCGTVFPFLFRRDHAAYLSVMHAYAQNAKATYSAEDEKYLDDLVRNVPVYCFLTRMMVPALSKCKERFVGMTAQARVTRAGLTALLRKQESGTYPSALADLNAGEWVDPFSGKPLFYRATPSGFLVYSVGENQVDDNGTVSMDRGEGDIVWRFPSEKAEGPSS